MDISMPGINGFAAARFLKQGLPSTVILMVSQFESAPFERDALAAGATAYILKSNASTELIPALRRIQSSRRS
jgi:DNA-binding NarL/FixJ family response regulator